MAKSGIELEGKVVEVLRGGQFKVQVLDTDVYVTCTLAGKIRLNKIRIQELDTVTIEVSEYEPSRGRIIWRSRKKVS